ncbi:hypothetical protein E4U43_003370 [Claviceps pusilla]|uniref:SGNH hydrolase-type esterase domain-containing protein n=1 Tax=Claviceps pusilla TaxID=123648 RepID=A0A9P7N591_9HYPO|nr:hypothetical protein E4U43_003370 [Claviceps pusilla]
MKRLVQLLLTSAHQLPLNGRNIESPFPLNPLPVIANPSDVAIKLGIELRILCVGDSITQGFLSETDGGDGNGFRLRLRDKLHYDNVVFAGTEFTNSGSMSDGYYSRATGLFQESIPSIVQRQLDNGHHVLAVNFTNFPASKLRDCIHPTNEGYRLLGDYWYDALSQVPKAWIQPPIGRDPERSLAAPALIVTHMLGLLLFGLGMSILSFWVR